MGGRRRGEEEGRWGGGEDEGVRGRRGEGGGIRMNRGSISMGRVSLCYRPAIAYSLKQILQFSLNFRELEVEGRCHKLCWGVPLVAALVCFAAVGYDSAGFWCWVRAGDGGETQDGLGAFLRFVVFYLPLWACSAFNCVVYMKLSSKLSTMLKYGDSEAGGLLGGTAAGQPAGQSDATDRVAGLGGGPVEAGGAFAKEGVGGDGVGAVAGVDDRSAKTNGFGNGRGMVSPRAGGEAGRAAEHVLRTTNETVLVTREGGWVSGQPPSRQVETMQVGAFLSRIIFSAQQRHSSGSSQQLFR